MNLERILAFTRVLQEFQAVERVMYAVGKEREENDVEHSYHLAMLAWYIAANAETRLDMEKVIRYALVHDLVEVYAGDTFVYSADDAHVASKHEREAAAAARLADEFPDFPDLHAAIRSYEAREDAESRFVYALDKIQPILHILLDEGRSWKRDGITLAMVKENKTAKVKVSPDIEPYFREILAILEERERDLFPS